MSRALTAIFRTEWLITEPALQNLIKIASRQNLKEKIEFDALHADSTDESKTGVLEFFGSTAVINVVGPIFRYANLFTRISGATSTQAIKTALVQAEDSEAESIVLVIDSPGGEAQEIADLAASIRNTSKPVTAYVGGMAASAAYWIASAADEVIVGPTAMLGSIGAVATITREDQETKDSYFEIVSSQSPKKRLDVETDEGKEEVQSMVDKLAAVFVADVALGRGVTEEKVLSDFGQGGLLIGAEAVAAGMADRMGSFESIYSNQKGGHLMPINSEEGNTTMRKDNDQTAPVATPKPVTLETIKSDHPSVYQEIFKAGARAELVRIKGVKAQSVKGFEQQIETMMFDGETSPEAAAVTVVKAMQESEGQHLQLIQQTQEPIAEDQGKPTSSDPIEKEWNADASLRADFDSLDDYREFKAAMGDGRIKGVAVKV